MNFVKRAAGVVLAGALVLAVGVGDAFALAGQVEYTGGAEKFIFLPQGDLFGAMKLLLPGSVAVQEITVRNSSATADLYLSIEHGDFVDAGQALASDALLSQLSLVVALVPPTGEPSVLYNGSATGAGGFVPLGRYHKGQTALLRATLTVPTNLPNDFMDATGTVKWVFAATPTPGRDDDNDDDSVTIVVPPVLKPLVQTGVLPETGSQG